jgi:hypothetical protein
MIATVQVAILDPSLQRVQLCSAGHPAPVLAAPGRPARTLDIPTDPPIGIAYEQRRATTIELPPGTVLCFYTDGLVERRDVPLEDNLQRLCDAAAADGTAEKVCHAIMNDLIGDTPPGDDTAVLVLHRLPVRLSDTGPRPHHPRTEEHPATPAQPQEPAPPTAPGPSRPRERRDRRGPTDHRATRTRGRRQKRMN